MQQVFNYLFIIRVFFLEYIARIVGHNLVRKSWYSTRNVYTNKKSYVRRKIHWQSKGWKRWQSNVNYYI